MVAADMEAEGEDMVEIMTEDTGIDVMIVVVGPAVDLGHVTGTGVGDLAPAVGVGAGVTAGAGVQRETPVNHPDITRDRRTHPDALLPGIKEAICYN